MGVDYHTCPHCEEPFADIGDNGYCSNCENWYCGYCYDDMVKQYGEIDESHEKFDYFGESLPKCPHCDGTLIDSEDLLGFALSKLNMSLEQLETEFREQMK